MIIVQNFLQEQNHKKEHFISDFTSKISTLIPLSIIVLPEEQLTINFRYNTELYSNDEIQKIAKDFAHVIQNIVIDNSIGTVDYMPIYQPTEKVNLAEELGHSKSSAIETNKSKVFLDQSLEEKILHIWKDNIGIQDITTCLLYTSPSPRDRG